MRKIFQFDGQDNGLLSVGECSEPDTVAICIKDRNGNEAQMLLNQESFKELCDLSYHINWAYPKRDSLRLVAQAHGPEVTNDPPF